MRLRSSEWLSPRVWSSDPMVKFSQMLRHLLARTLPIQEMTPEVSGVGKLEGREGTFCKQSSCLSPFSSSSLSTDRKYLKGEKVNRHETL